MTAAAVLLPWPIDDAQHPSGGNRYDRRILTGLRAHGWQCDEHIVPGRWPQPGEDAIARLAAALAGLAPGTVVLLDGIMAPGADRALVAAARRLALVVLLHMPFGEAFPALADAERRALAAAAAVVTTSAWTRHWICDHYALPPARVHVATPGVDSASLAPGSAAGGRLLCVANVSRLKGHDVLLEALATLADLKWTCTCAGALPADPGFTDELRARARDAGIEARLHYAGPLDDAALDATYGNADVLVVASRRESYGMAVSEALARGLPVIAADAGGVAEAMGHAPNGDLPGALVAPESPTALAAALRTWLQDGAARARWRHAAAQRRDALQRWSATAARIAGVLHGVRHGERLA